MNGEKKDFGEIKCMRAKINCEEGNQGLRRRGTRAQEESKKVKGENKKVQKCLGKDKMHEVVNRM